MGRMVLTAVSWFGGNLIQNITKSNAKGFSILPLLILGTLVGANVMYFGNLFSKGVKIQRTLNSTSTSENLRVQVEQLIGRGTFCGANLAGKEIDPSSSDPNDKRLTGLTLVNPAAPEDPIAAPGMQLDTNTKVTDIVLEDLKIKTGNAFYANLKIRFARARVLGSENLEHKMELLVQTNPTNTGLDAPTRRVIIGCGLSKQGSAMSGPFTNSSLYDVNGTFVVPEGVSQIMVEAWGGGAGGGSAHRTSSPDLCFGGGGGGAGGYGRKILVVTPGDTFDVVVGRGGTRGMHPPLAGGDGEDGGDSSFGTVLTATGGKKGLRGRPDTVPPQRGRGGSGGISNGVEFIPGGPGMDGDSNYKSTLSAFGSEGGNPGRYGAGSGGGVGGWGGYCFGPADSDGGPGTTGRVMVWF